MSEMVQTKDIHHLTLTVTNLEKSCDFYTSVLGFQFVMDLGPRRMLLSNGKCVLALTLPFDPARAIQDDAFNENRVGIDHLSFNINSLDEMKNAVALFDRKAISHGEIKDLGPAMGIYVLAFRDPDQIQLELTAPYNP